MLPNHFKHICKQKGWKVKSTNKMKVNYSNLSKSKGFYEAVGHETFGAFLTPKEAEKINNA